MKSRQWALAQVDATPDLETNLDQALRQVDRASKRGCSLVCFPEYFLIRAAPETLIKHDPKPFEDALKELRSRADENKINVVAGTIPEKTAAEQKFYNTTYYIDTRGRIVDKYRKIHRFDVQLEDLLVEESAYLKRGRSTIELELDGLRCGASICYDLRFPELFRRLAGVEVIFIPSNFTARTGRAHWKPLVRSRAIENQCYTVAPDQCGMNRETRVNSYGHSLVVGPWGEVVAEAGETTELLIFDIRPEQVEKAREQLPALDHRELK